MMTRLCLLSLPQPKSADEPRIGCYSADERSLHDLVRLDRDYSCRGLPVEDEILACDTNST